MITDKFIHIHVPRTGGTSTRNFLFNACKDKKDITVFDRRFHLTLLDSRKVVEKRGGDPDVPSFCIVRNPWDWYVSAYSFLGSHGRGGVSRIGGNADADQKKQHNQEKFKAFVRAVSDRNETGNPHPECQWRYWLKRFKTYGECFYTMTEPGIDYIGRFENLSEDLSDILGKFDSLELGDERVKSELSKRKAHKTAHAPYRDFYDEDTKQIVADMEKKFIEEFGYEF